MKDGLIVMYMKNDVLYPVGMSEEEFKMLQFLGNAIFPEGVKVGFDKPQSTAINLAETKQG